MDTIPAAAISASGSNYIRFSNGVQICWGYNSATNREWKASFGSAFLNTNYAISTTCHGNNAQQIGDNGVLSKTTTTITLHCTLTTAHLSFIAIGSWK